MPILSACSEQSFSPQFERQLCIDEAALRISRAARPLRFQRIFYLKYYASGVGNLLRTLIGIAGLAFDIFFRTASDLLRHTCVNIRHSLPDSVFDGQRIRAAMRLDNRL